MCRNEAAAAEAGNAPPLREDEIWRREAGGHLVHIQSGAVCADSIAGIKRTETHIYIADGTDVSCNYDSGPAALTLYVYTRNSTVQHELDEALSAMRDRQPLSTDAPFSMEISGILSHTLAYNRADGTEYRTSALVTEAGGWKLKLRITAPARLAPDLERRASIALMGQKDRLSTLRPTPAPSANPT